MKTLSEWLDDINQWTHGKIDLDLSRIFDIAKKDPSLLKFHCPVITVAGTNGKGSVVKTLETIYSLSGYSVGTYTSPHILRFNERIRYQGLDIDDENLVSCFEYIEKLRGDIPLTFFEFTTLSAFYYFQKMQPDVLILEVGMGGRLDAVNAVDSDVAVVTSVDLDHMDYLGSTRELIGFEKAGIARAQKPLVFMDKTLPLSVENYANKIGADLICLGKDFFYKREVSTWSFSAVSDTHAARDTRAARHPERSRGISSNRLDADDERSLGGTRDDGDTHLPLPHLKLQNVAGALMVIELLQKRLPVSLACIKKGISEAKLAGRFEYAHHKGLVFDVAHNPASMQWLAKQIQFRHPAGKKYAIFSMLKDKDISTSVLPLIEVVDVWLVAGLEVLRAEIPEKITEILSTQGAKKWYNFSGVDEALSFALEDYDASKDLIVVCGSFHTVEAAKLYLKRKENGS